MPSAEHIEHPPPQRSFLGVPQPVDPHQRLSGRLVVRLTQVLERAEPGHLVLRWRCRAVEAPPWVLVGVYRRRNAAVVRRLLEAAGRSTRVAWWALDEIAPELADVTMGVGAGVRGVLLNRLVHHLDPPADTWIVISDDDWEFVRGTFGDLLRAAVAAGLDLVQPSHAAGSHLNWNITRHRLGCLARRGRYVEQGPVLALDPRARLRILPLPTDLGMGWGVEALWWAETSLQLGVVDGVTIRHLTPVGHGGYDTTEQWAQSERLVRATGRRNWSELQPDLGRWRWWRERPGWDGPDEVPAP